MKRKLNLNDYLKYSEFADEIKHKLEEEGINVDEAQILRSSCNEEIEIPTKHTKEADLDRWKEVEVDEPVDTENAEDIEEEEGESEVYESYGYASTRKIDFSGDIVLPEGIDLSVYSKNPVVFYNHYQKEFPVGKAVSLNVDSYGMRIGIKYAAEEYPKAKTLYKLVKGGYVRQHSIGFVPMQALLKGTKGFDAVNRRLMSEYPEYQGNANRIITKTLILEVSVVNIADNQASTIFDVKSFMKNHEDFTDADVTNLKSLGIAEKVETVETVETGEVNESTEVKEVVDGEERNDSAEVDTNVLPEEIKFKEIEVELPEPPEYKSIEIDCNVITIDYKDVKIVEQLTKSGLRTGKLL